MKILFIHLSDIHADTISELINIKTDKLTDAIKASGNIDECFLIISGDLAYSGNSNEYRTAKRFIGKVLEEIGRYFDKFIKVFVVPGNHDMILKDNDRDFDEIQGYYNEGIEKYHELELDRFKEFISYAQTKNCFLRNNAYDIKYYENGGVKIQFTLLNTAPFSTLVHNDKELHYISDEALEAIVRKDNVNINIVVMHHSVEWFNENTKNMLENILYKNCDILFQGHEHIIESLQCQNSYNDSIQIFKGGEYSGRITKESSFSVVVFNTDSNEYIETIFKWDGANSIFIHDEKEPKKINLKSYSLRPNKEYYDQLLKDNQGLCNNLLDYYVFPKIVNKDSTKIENKNKVINEHEFIDLLHDNKIINITCSGVGGKTTILKYLYNKLLKEGYIPLFLENEGYNPKRIKTIVDDLFREQYSDNQVEYSRYKQTDKSKIIILIDDLDYIKSNDRLLKYIINDVGHVIFTSKEVFNPDVIQSACETLNINDVITLKIVEFYKDKRLELINKICKVNGSKKVNEIDNVIDHLLKKEHNLFGLSPDFIIQYIKHYINGGTRVKEEDSFNVIFEFNLRKKIIENSKGRNVKLTLTLLEELAYDMYIRETEFITSEEIFKFVEKYCQDNLLECNILSFIDTAINSNVLVDIDNNLRFSSRNYLAYFIAKTINRRMNNGITDDVYYILKFICFGINDNILLFLSYLRDNKNIVLALCNEAEEVLSDIKELDFNNTAIGFLDREEKIEAALPTTSEKTAYQKSVASLEEEIRSEDTIKYKSIFEFDKSDMDKYKVARVAKYLEIIAKFFVNQFIPLSASEKERIVSCLYSIPNKILNALFEDIDKNYDEIITSILRLVKNIDIGDNEKARITREKIEETVWKVCIAICLSLYDEVGYNSATLETLPVLDKFKTSSINGIIQNLQMWENSGNSSAFINKAIGIMETTKDGLLQDLIRSIVRKHIITNDIDYKTLDRISNKNFMGDNKKELLMISQASNE